MNTQYGIVIYMLTDVDLQQIEEIVDRKLDEKLDQKLDQKLDEKFDEKMEPWVERFMEVFATKEDVNELKDRMDTFEETQQKILQAVEGFASTKDQKTFEDAARDAQLNRHDGWIHQIAKETKVKLKD